MQLTKIQTKTIRAIAKADCRSPEQMLSMIIDVGLDWIFCEHGENTSPFLGWPDNWKEITEELQKEYKKNLEVDE